MMLSYKFIFLLQLLFSFSQAATITKNDLGSDILKAIESATTCAGCNAALLLLKGAALFGDGPFVSVFTELCKLSKAEDDDVCTGAVGAEGPIIAQALRSMTIPSHTSQLFCITFFGLCAYPAVTSYTVPFPSPKPATTRPAVSSQPPIQIVHFSDIHVDPFYVTGASYNCTKPICCRSYTTADSPGNNQYPAGQYGDTHCDAPVSLEESMYSAIKTIAPNAALTLFTGDIVDHAVWLASKAQNIQDINDTYSRMSGLNNVYGTIGNHEAAPVNAFPSKAQTTAAFQQQWVYDTVSTNLGRWINSTSVQETDNFGAYSIEYPGGKLRIISLNTNLYYIENFWLYEKTMETDPSGQFAWLVNELQAAETAGDRVYIIGHMPMGLPDAFRDASDYFDQIVSRYSATIAALFFGHTHSDEFQLSYTSYAAQSFTTAQMVSYICPSLTPTSGHPSFRIYTVDPVTFSVLDSTTYFANISSPTYQTLGPVWEKLYSAKETYGPLLSPPLTDPGAELTPAFWHNLTSVFQANDSSFQLYESLKSRTFLDSDCTGACKTAEICQMRAGQSQYNCNVHSPGIHFSKRDIGGEEVVVREEGELTVSECEGSLIRPILAKIVAQDGLLERTLEKRFGKL